MILADMPVENDNFHLRIDGHRRPRTFATPNELSASRAGWKEDCWRGTGVMEGGLGQRNYYWMKRNSGSWRSVDKSKICKRAPKALSTKSR
ncbi:hypothetical protein EVAR_23827_1 [Eumeta japonica]|uniref:Uncharacterized protein n=1 Tax=Eumeta variegata TaxID=151549 RepID=A0A4C1VKG5_EUMVA|nr:hypothetical protein EVAR_23827_1 [Eumeta japonica]